MTAALSDTDKIKFSQKSNIISWNIKLFSRHLFHIVSDPVVQSQFQLVSILKGHDPGAATSKEQGLGAQDLHQGQVVTSGHKYGRVLGGIST